MKLSHNFELREFIHPDIYAVCGDRSLDFLNPSLWRLAQRLRDEFGPLTVNDWPWGGAFKDSGLRAPDSLGAKFSAHRFGTAIDCKFADISPVEVYEAILTHEEAYPDITRMENAHKTITWLHVEVGVRHGQIITFDP